MLDSSSRFSSEFSLTIAKVNQLDSIQVTESSRSFLFIIAGSVDMVPRAKGCYQKAPFENHCLVGSVMNNATLQIARTLFIILPLFEREAVFGVHVNSLFIDSHWSY